MTKFISVIMAGGKGQRFWPLSTETYPKQFLDLERQGRSLLQSTFDRLLLLSDKLEYIYVATTKDYLPLVQQQLPDLPVKNIILEPIARDSGPAVALASLYIRQIHGDVITGFFPSDHRIGDVERFYNDLQKAIDLTETTRGIVTLGIRPTYPAIGYGYIQSGNAIHNGFNVERFVEKPNEERARDYIRTGNYFWNAGMFLWHTSTIASELRNHAPQMMEVERALIEGTLNTVYPTLPKISIDYCLMEKTSKAHVIPTTFDWDDLGDWNALERLINKTHNTVNTVVGKHIGIETRNSFIYSEDDKDIVITLGVSDLVIVKRDNLILVSSKNKTQEIKQALKDETLQKIL
jgi:mannose-1-phosphate guanylyltransferase